MSARQHLVIRLDLYERGAMIDVIRARLESVVLELAQGHQSGIIRDPEGRAVGEYIFSPHRTPTSP